MLGFARGWAFTSLTIDRRRNKVSGFVVPNRSRHEEFSAPMEKPTRTAIGFVSSQKLRKPRRGSARRAVDLRRSRGLASCRSARAERVSSKESWPDSTSLAAQIWRRASFGLQARQRDRDHRPPIADLESYLIGAFHRRSIRHSYAKRDG